MSNFLCACFWSPRPRIPEEYLRPQGLYSLERVDLKKLKRLIRNQQLAPCHPGVEEPAPGHDLEECPICFLHYPVLNSSLCCHKRVCTECFLQVQTSTPPHQLSSCPFCKVTRSTGYLVKLIGVRTAEEKEQEREEEQKVIEARIREREEELRRDQERALQRQQQQQAAGAAAAGTNRTGPGPTATNNNNGGSSAQQQHPSAGVIAAAAAAAASLEPCGGTNAGAAAVGRTAGRGSASAVSAGAQDAGRYQGNDRHRSAATTTAAVTTGAASTAVVQMGGGGGGGGAGVYPTASVRRAAAMAAMSAALQHQQSGHRLNNHHTQHPGDRYIVGSEAAAGAQPEGPASGGAVAHGGGGAGGGGHPRRHPGGGGGRRYRLTDYVPAGVVDIALGLDDINDLMLEQAMYESLAEAAGANPPAEAQSAAAPAATAATGGDGAVTDPENDADLAAALAASLSGGGGAGALAAERAALAQPMLSPRAPSLAVTATAGGPAGRSGWRQASGSPAANLTYSIGGDGGSGGLTARPSAVASGALQAAQGGRMELPQPPPPRRRSAAAVAAAAAAERRDGRPATARPQPRAWATPLPASTPAARDRREACELHDRAEEVEEEDEEDSLMSRRTAPPVPSASGDHERPASCGAESASGASRQSPSAPAPQKAEAAAAPLVDAAVPQSAGLSGHEPASSASPSPPTRSPTQCPGGSSPLADRTCGDAAVAAAPGAVRASPTTLGAQSPASLSPLPSESPVGALAAGSDFSSAVTGGGGPRDDLLDAVSGGGGASGGGASGGGEQHLTNPLYDIWSNSSSATTGTYKMGSDAAPGPVAAAAVAGDQEEVAVSGRPVGGAAAASGRWNVKGASQRSSMGSDGGVAPQCSERQGLPVAVIPTSPPALQEQHHISPSASGDVSQTADRVAAPGRPQPLRPPQPPPPPLATAAPATPTSLSACSPGGGGGLTTPSPRLGLPPLDVSALAAAAPHPSEAAAPAGGAPAEAGPSTLPQGGTVVTIQTLAAELLRHGSGPAAAATGAGDAPNVMTVGMVFLTPSRGGGGGGWQAPASATAAALEGPAWVENPDGSLQVLLPVAPGSGAAASGPPPQRHRRSVGGYVATSDDVMEVPYTDYELSELQPLPSLASPTGLDLPPDALYIADGGNDAAPVAIEGMDPAVAEAAEAADEAVRQLCGEADGELVRLTAAQDAAITAAIAAHDHVARPRGAGNDDGGSKATGKDKGVR